MTLCYSMLRPFSAKAFCTYFAFYFTPGYHPFLKIFLPTMFIELSIGAFLFSF